MLTYLDTIRSFKPTFRLLTFLLPTAPRHHDLAASHRQPSPLTRQELRRLVLDMVD